jgi:hypothetical protein
MRTQIFVQFTLLNSLHLNSIFVACFLNCSRWVDHWYVLTNASDALSTAGSAMMLLRLLFLRLFLVVDNPLIIRTLRFFLLRELFLLLRLVLLVRLDHLTVRCLE